MPCLSSNFLARFLLPITILNQLVLNSFVLNRPALNKLALSLLIFSLLVLSAPSFFNANLAKAASEPPALAPQQFAQLNKLNTALKVENSVEAQKLAEEIWQEAAGNSEQKAFMRSFAARALVPIYLEKGKGRLAGKMLEELLEQEAEFLDLETLQASRWQLVYVLTNAGQNAKALRQLELWWQQEEAPTPQAHYLRAALLANLERWSQAEPFIRTALKAQQPQSWLELGVAIMQQQEHWVQAASWQQLLVELNPEKPKLWRRLAQLQLLAGQEKAALVTLELARKQGYLAFKHQQQLALRLLAQQQPLLAAQILEHLLAEAAEAATGNADNKKLELKKPEIRELERLAAQAWLLTNQPQPTQAALERLFKSSNKPEEQQLLGQWLFSQGLWQEAVNSWQQMLKRQQLAPEDAHKINLLIAQAYIEKADYASAQEVLQQLLNSGFASESQQATAKQWLAYLQAL